MDGTNLLLTLIIAIFAIFYLQKMFKSVATVAGLTMVIAFLYLLFSGRASPLLNPDIKSIFKKDNISEMYGRYCCKGCVKNDKPVCKCIIEEVYSDYYYAYSQSKRERMEADAAQTGNHLTPELERIVNDKMHDIEFCLEENGSSKIKFIDKLKRGVEIMRE